MSRRLSIAVVLSLAAFCGCRSLRAPDTHLAGSVDASSLITWDSNAQGVVSSSHYTAFVASTPLTFGMPSRSTHQEAADPFVEFESSDILLGFDK